MQTLDGRLISPKKRWFHFRQDVWDMRRQKMEFRNFTSHSSFSSNFHANPQEKGEASEEMKISINHGKANAQPP